MEVLNSKLCSRCTRNWLRRSSSLLLSCHCNKEREKVAVSLNSGKQQNIFKYGNKCPLTYDRKYVERELFTPDEVPERHNLSFFPTVNDIKNHIHEVQKSLRNGEMVYNSESIPATVCWPLCIFLVFGVKYWKS